MEVRPSLRASSPPEGRLAFNNFGCVPWCCLSRIVYRGIKQYKGCCLSINALHDLRRYTIPQCWTPHTQTQR
jgi:hypothetical protein